MSFYTLKRETCIYKCLIAIWGKGMNVLPGLIFRIFSFPPLFWGRLLSILQAGSVITESKKIVSKPYRHEITKTRTYMARDIIYLVKQLVGRSYDRTTKPCLQNIELRVQNPHNTNSIPVKTLE